MKVLVLTLLLTIAVAFAIPVELDATDDDNSQVTLIDVDNEQPLDDNASEVTRPKRFLLAKKVILAKAGLLGVGALGLAGAAAAKSAIGGIGGIGLGGIGGIGGGHGGPQPYGPSYGYGNVPTSVQSAPIGYYPSQSYVPPPPQVQPIQTVQQIQPVPVQQIQAAPIQAAPVQTIQPTYGQPSYGGPLSAALAWKSGLVSGITNSLSNGIVGLRPPIAAAPAYSYAPAPSYSYAPAPAPVVSAPILSTPGTDIPVAPIAQVAPAAQVAPVQPNPNKPVYVVCDNQ